jgi:hypothetical protein
VVYAKRPFAGPQAVLAYLSRYTHRVAISNSRLVAWTSAASPSAGRTTDAKGRHAIQAMTLAPEEFMRRFLLHVLPGGFHRIRHYGLLANGARKTNLGLVRELLHIVPAQAEPASNKLQAGELPIAAPPHSCAGTAATR